MVYWKGEFMPTYRFKCNECDLVFEQKMPVTRLDLPVPCPKGHLKTQRIFTVPSIVFKGSGFYSTDHRPKGGSTD
jgi:putative FmdB family regulatory protein